MTVWNRWVTERERVSNREKGVVGDRARQWERA